VPLLIGGHNCGTCSTWIPSTQEPIKKIHGECKSTLRVLRRSGVTKMNGKIHKTVWYISLSGDHQRRRRSLCLGNTKWCPIYNTFPIYKMSFRRCDSAFLIVPNPAWHIRFRQDTPFLKKKNNLPSPKFESPFYFLSFAWTHWPKLLPKLFRSLSLYVFLRLSFQGLALINAPVISFVVLSIPRGFANILW